MTQNAQKKLTEKDINFDIHTYAECFHIIRDERKRGEISACRGILIQNGVPEVTVDAWPLNTILASGKALLKAKLDSSVSKQKEKHKETESTFAKHIRPFLEENSKRIFDLSAIEEDPKPSKTVSLLREYTADGNILSLSAIVLNDKPNNKDRKRNLEEREQFLAKSKKLASTFGLKKLVDWITFDRGTADQKSKGINLKPIKITGSDGQTYSLKASIGIRPMTEKEIEKASE